MKWAAPRVLFRIAALSLFWALGCDREACPQPTPKPLENGGVGEPCGATANCAAGLFCREIYDVAGYDSPSFTANACTTSCDGGCPGTATCVTLPSSIVTCLKVCASDDDCRVGTSAGTCQGGHCERLQCTEDSQCPAGFHCEIPAVVCCPSGAQCVFAGKVPGYCRKG
ncbi:MAG: hypothetical protein IPJ65_32830 [Archangiaceae bacterium]|nr:hypothetical protein [Archangiaceae bacterium]